MQDFTQNNEPREVMKLIILTAMALRPRYLSPSETCKSTDMSFVIVLSPHLSDSISYQLSNPLPCILENIYLCASIEQFDEETPPSPDQRAGETPRPGFHTPAGRMAAMTLPFLTNLLQIHISLSFPPLSSCASWDHRL